jgi:4'-phosphopantetheinyl transferase
MEVISFRDAAAQERKLTSISLDRLIGVCQGRDRQGATRNQEVAKPMNTDCGESGLPTEVLACPSLWVWLPGEEVGEIAPNEIRVWVIDLDAGVSTDQVETAEPGPESSLLSPDEQERAARFVRARDRRRFVCCRAALRSILGGLLRQPPDSLRFRAALRGKPELDRDSSGENHADQQHALYFNVSHSSELALIGVCRGHELGVDLEKVRTIHEADRIVASFFSPAEHAEFATIHDDLKPLAFFRGWTRKEAILKGLGIGLAGLSARYETRFGTSELAPHFTPVSPVARVDEWRLWEAGPRADFVATVAVRVPVIPDPPAAGTGTPGTLVASTGEDPLH